MRTKKKVRIIETYVREHKLARSNTRPSAVERKLRKEPKTEIAVNVAG